MPPPITYESAKALAEEFIEHESANLEDGDFFVIPDQLSREESWGWIFEPVVEPYWSDKTVCPYGGDGLIAVNRYTGKVSPVIRSLVENDDWPEFDVVMTSSGPNRGRVFSLLRKHTGCTARQAQGYLQSHEVCVVTGPRMSVESVFKALVEAGAAVEMIAKDT